MRIFISIIILLFLAFPTLGHQQNREIEPESAIFVIEVEDVLSTTEYSIWQDGKQILPGRMYSTEVLKEGKRFFFEIRYTDSHGSLKIREVSVRMEPGSFYFLNLSLCPVWENEFWT